MFKVILISGDRNWTSWPVFNTAMDKWVAKHGMPEIIVEGCATGADTFAEKWAHIKGVTVDHYPAQWGTHDSYGQTCWCKNKSATRCNGAGPIRNKAMLVGGKPEAVIAFHPNLAVSKGTGNMVKIARAAGVPVWVPVPQPQQSLGL